LGQGGTDTHAWTNCSWSHATTSPTGLGWGEAGPNLAVAALQCIISRECRLKARFRRQMHTQEYLQRILFGVARPCVCRIAPMYASTPLIPNKRPEHR